jgi:hypothetical protein
VEIPAKISGLLWLAVLTGLYAFVWIGLEGDLGQVVLMGLAVGVVSAGFVVQRFWGGRWLGGPAWLVFAGLVGLSVGLGSGLWSLFFMALKTGLHGHGPEFAPAEIEWLLGQIPLWTAAGAAAGLGLGLLLKGRK